MRLPTLPIRTDKHIEDRLKLLASLCQSVTLALYGAAIIAPLFVTHTALTWDSVIAGIIASMFEGAAIALLRYIPANPVP